MQPESEAAWDEITAILNAKGNKLSQADREDITIISMRFDTEDMIEMVPMLEEALWMVAASPDYEGDIIL